MSAGPLTRTLGRVSSRWDDGPGPSPPVGGLRSADAGVGVSVAGGGSGPRGELRLGKAFWPGGAGSGGGAGSDGAGPDDAGPDSGAGVRAGPAARGPGSSWPGLPRSGSGSRGLLEPGSSRGLLEPGSQSIRPLRRRSRWAWGAGLGDGCSVSMHSGSGARRGKGGPPAACAQLQDGWGCACTAQNHAFDRPRGGRTAVVRARCRAGRPRCHGQARPPRPSPRAVRARS